MSVVARAPHPALRGLVGRYAGYDLHLHPRAVHYGLPGAAATVILSLGEPVDTTWSDASAGAGDRYRALAAGLHLRPALIRTHGRQHGLQLDLSPLGVRALLGVPMGDLSGVMVHHADLPLGVPESVHARLSQAGTWTERFDLLDAHLLSLARADRRATGPERAAHEAWALLSDTAGRTTVADLADRLGWSRRHLSSLVRAELGVSPKEAARLHRFDHARRLARQGTPLAHVAARAGYADQAHLSREWKGFAGRSPSAADEFPVEPASP